jgi:hypothetical protein
MNVLEGARRMRYAGVWLALIAACWRALVFCIQTATASLLLAGTGGISGGLKIGAIVGGLGIGDIILWATPGVLLWVAGWIVEGFAKDTP